MSIVVATLVVAVVGTLAAILGVWCRRRSTVITEKTHKDLRAPELPKQITDALSRIRETKNARIGLVHYPPFSSCLDGEPAEGLYVELIQSLLGSEGVTPQFIPLRFSGAVEAVTNGEVDMTLSVFQRLVWDRNLAAAFEF